MTRRVAVAFGFRVLGLVVIAAAAIFSVRACARPAPVCNAVVPIAVWAIYVVDDPSAPALVRIGDQPGAITPPSHVATSGRVQPLSARLQVGGTLSLVVADAAAPPSVGAQAVIRPGEPPPTGQVAVIVKLSERWRRPRYEGTWRAAHPGAVSIHWVPPCALNA